ncbi:hypothetical protein HWV62_38486 [Athelia sp. TMB]|nr:hypothetical protein HWV62_38486 [Athelia sp. TMB]
MAGVSEAMPFRAPLPKPPAGPTPSWELNRDPPPHLSIPNRPAGGYGPAGSGGGGPGSGGGPGNGGGPGGNGGPSGGWGRGPYLPPSGPPNGPRPAGRNHNAGGNGPPPGGGPGGGGGNPGNGGPGYFPRYEYGPSIEQEIKPEQLPSWDGEYDTVIQYFHDLEEFASLGGNIPERMGFWLWKTLKKDSGVARWYAGLSTNLKTWMRIHYLNYVEVILHYYLGREWQQHVELQYQQQTFRQKGHEQETPHDFILRRILYTRMLLQVEPDTAQEVYYICKKNPNAWESLLVRDSIPDTTTLLLRVRDLEAALTDAWNKSLGKVVTSENLLSILQKAGIKITPQEGRSSYRPYRRGTSSVSVSAHHVEGEKRTEDSDEEEPSVEALPDDDTILHQAFAVMKKDPPPSRRGPFPFAQRDKVNTSMAKPPHWPCKACGSKNHWDRECPHWDVYKEKIKHAKLVEKEDSPEENTVYSQVYQAMRAQYISSAYVDEGEFQKLSLKVQAQRLEKGSASELKGIAREYPRASVEEVEDEEVVATAMKPKCETGALLEDEESEQEEPTMEAHWSAKEEDPLPPPPKEEEIFVLRKRKKSLPGMAALGISVLSMKGRVGSMEEELIDLRLDSCANVSLVSSESVKKLKHKVPICQGMKMRLWQLTDRNSTLEGYVNLPLFVESEDGRVIQTEVEAYVVPGMSVDILLGEDYQLAFEMTTSRHVEKGTTVSYRNCPYRIKAEAVGRSKDFEKVAPTHVSHAAYVRAKSHRREQSRCFRKRRKCGEEKRTIRAKQDTLIQPHSVASIRVDSHFEDERDWLVEKSLIANTDDSFFAVPNVLFSSKNPVIPVMNPFDVPRYVRKGESVGVIVDPGRSYWT